MDRPVAAALLTLTLRCLRVLLQTPTLLSPQERPAATAYGQKRAAASLPGSLHIQRHQRRVAGEGRPTEHRARPLPGEELRHRQGNQFTESFGIQLLSSENVSLCCNLHVYFCGLTKTPPESPEVCCGASVPPPPSPHLSPPPIQNSRFT